jgi:hypothetical protein
MATETETDWTIENVTAPNRFQFGDKPHQSLPVEWIEPFLRCIYEKNRNLFGDAVLRAMDAERTDRRYRGRSNG